MSSNSSIRTLHFAQGVEVVLANGILDESNTIDLANNLVTVISQLPFDLLIYREIVFNYTIRRRTDAPATRFERGQFRLTANPDGATDPDKWIIAWDFKNDEGVASGVVFTLNVTAGVVELQVAVDNMAGANHHCFWSYELTTFLV